MQPTRTCPRCGNTVWKTIDRCPIDGTPLVDNAATPAPDPRAPTLPVPPRPAARIVPSKAPQPAKLMRATDLTVDIPDERPADRGRSSEDLNVFDALAKPGSAAQNDASLLDDARGLRPKRGNKTAKLVVGLLVLGAGLAAWTFLRPGAKTAEPVLTTTPVAAPKVEPSPPPVAPTPAAPPPAPALAAAPPKPEPAAAKTPTAATAAPPSLKMAERTPGKVPERTPGKTAGARPHSSMMYGVPVPAALMPKNPDPAPAPAPAAAAPTPSPPPAPGADADALLRKAQQAWLNHHYAVAIENAREVLKERPSSLAAYQIIATCSCSLGNAVEAREAASHLDDKKRKLALTVCERNGIKTEE